MLKVNVLNINLSRVTNMQVDEADLRLRSLLGNEERLSDLQIDRKEDICRELVMQVDAKAGGTYLLPACSPPSPVTTTSLAEGNKKFLGRALGKLQHVDIEVEVCATHQDMVLVRVNHLISPTIQRSYELKPLPLVLWRDLGFPKFDWQIETDGQHLCKEVIRSLDAYQGYPVIAIRETVILPTNFDPLDETRGE